MTASIVKPIIIGIAGGSGSGKTTVTRSILEKLDSRHVSSISHDSYYKDITAFNVDDPSKINFDHPNSLDTELLVEHLKMLLNHEPIPIPVYDFTTFRRKQDTDCLMPSLVIRDGRNTVAINMVVSKINQLVREHHV